MYARITTVQIQPEQLEAELAARDAPNTERDAMLAQLAKEPGFQGTLFFVDRQSGKTVTIGMWASEAALQASLAGHGARGARTADRDVYAAPPVVEIYELLREVRPREQAHRMWHSRVNGRGRASAVPPPRPNEVQLERAWRIGRGATVPPQTTPDVSDYT